MATVLVVDVDPAMCLRSAAIHENHGFDVHSTVNGVRAQTITPGRYAR
jgi:hypothetical protein